MINDFLSTTHKQFVYYKSLGDKTFQQLTDEQLFWRPDEEANSVTVIVKHMWGNMLSRWTDFLTSDGEKEWRQREAEFEADIQSREEMLEKWEAGWTCVFDALATVKEDNFDTVIYIRNQGHTMIQAVLRQLSHYAYHVGQIVWLGRMLAGKDWDSLSIPRGGSAAFNAGKFAQPKRMEHFSEEFVEGEE
ncbi:MAG: DUF1572 family protein [Bacteroidota bacterium]